jgi:glycosyltransferase involved in cell wall biosynthesis
MVTTFFGAQATGGDAAYVDRLSRALLRRGHEVEVIHDGDAFAAAREGVPEHSYQPPDGLRVHTLRSRAGRLSPLWTHQTGGLGPTAGALRGLLERGRFDVVHFHNISLIGGPGAIRAAASLPAVRLMTLHEHWLVCPLSLLWKMDREPCERPQCVRCTINAGRPPQLWRATSRIDRALEDLDAIVSPSASATAIHRARGIRAPIVELGHLLPADWAGAGARGRAAAPGEPRPGESRPGESRPYLVAAGRLVREKGFESLVRSMARLPGVDLRIAGAGPLEPELRELARALPNVELTGRLDPAPLAELFAGALALVVPSLFYETFGYVVLEAGSVGTPAIVRNRGALPEVVGRLGAGLVFDTEDELVAAVSTLADDPELRARMGARAREGVEREGGEDRHVAGYLRLVAECAERRGPAVRVPKAATRHGARAGAL